MLQFTRSEMVRHFQCNAERHELTGPANESGFMPGGVEATEATIYEKIEPVTSLLHCLLAVMYASTADSQDTVRDASVMGFVFVAEVDEKKRRLKVLAPMNTRVSDRPMIWGSWPESSVSLVG